MMPKVYGTADVLILPSDGRETWGLVANGALACGRPVVLSDAVESAPDLAADGKSGRVFPVGNVGALADAVAEVVDRNPPPIPSSGPVEGIAVEFVTNQRTSNGH
jgi:glycosyltransferase involved in cell wall biosynthesis